MGHADRSAYDLNVHSKATKTDLVAREIYPEPREEDVVVVKANKGLLGKTFKMDNAAIVAALDELSASNDTGLALSYAAAQVGGGAARLVIDESSGKSVELTAEMCTFSVERKRITERKYVPSVIEPSFGIGRIITGVLEHCFYVREGDEQRAVLSFPAAIAPYKVVLLPLDGRIDCRELASLATALNSVGISSVMDDSGASVGKRYSRADEVGTPFAVTYDHVSLKDAAVTVRERDSTGQVRLPLGSVVETLGALVGGKRTWAEVSAQYGLLKGGDDEAAAAAAPSSIAATSSPILSTARGLTLAGQGTVKTGSVGVAVKMEGATYGRFARPADL